MPGSHMGMIHADTGRIQEVFQIEKKRYCKHCSKLLSKYNPNDYCFIHVRQSIKDEEIAKDKKLKKQNDQQKKIRDAKVKAKKEANVEC